MDADRQAIVDLMHDYCYWVDGNRPDEQVKVFTEDCVANYGSGPDIVGRDALEAMLVKALARFEATHHHVSNIRIQFAGDDEATATSYVHAWHRFVDDSLEDFHLFAEYHDRWVRTPDGWRCAERRLQTAGATPPRPDLAGLSRRRND